LYWIVRSQLPATVLQLEMTLVRGDRYVTWLRQGRLVFNFATP